MTTLVAMTNLVAMIMLVAMTKPVTATASAAKTGSSPVDCFLPRIDGQGCNDGESRPVYY